MQDLLIGRSRINQKTRRARWDEPAGPSQTPAVTYSRAGSTTIGPGCLTAVFGTGTGVATRVWSPGSRLDVAGRVRVAPCGTAVRERVRGSPGSVRSSVRLLVPVR